ncbi:Dimethyladenosine transferase 1, mitochondrial [Apophysomyces ossiformis]|uniref:rRNA adenine N(6)-methyltransferase n=1 Tax=Apophysomyces ossiformis TaxID=679940 RepID=A0A8H7BRC0_9FUNG|nr:Dimethyladenosine transferase 1, mitochondrial [Apophysomyces ossiformis]
MLELPHQTILGAAAIQDPTAGPMHIIGNLPFNVATPLLLQWLRMLSERQGLFSKSDIWMTLMFQKEVAQRLTAEPSTAHRGRLAVMTQSLCHAKTVYQVPSSVFVPRPKVDASVVQLKPKLPFTSRMESDVYSALEGVLRVYFTKRRKTVGNITRQLSKELCLPDSVLADMESIVDFKARPEDITTEQFWKVAELFVKRKIAL